MILCASCGHANPIAQKFCGECGARLPAEAASHGSVSLAASKTAASSYTPPHLAKGVLTSRFAVEGERKLVTVMFCDIVDSTSLAARLGAEAMHGLLNRIFELALTEVHRYEGTINQFAGDGFMSLFGAPIAHEDHARRGLLAAAAIQQRMRDGSGEAQALRDVRLRMGLHTGIVVVGSIGDKLRMDYTANGVITHLAARLEAFAEPGTIRVSEATRRAAAMHFEFKGLGRHSLKGVAEPVAIFEPLGPRSAVAGGLKETPGRGGSILVGREHELAALSRALEELRKGMGGVVIVRGEPGVGKSRLLTEVRHRDAAAGLLRLEGHVLSFGRSLSYWPFIELIKKAFGIDASDAELEALHKLEVGVGALFDTRAAEIVPYIATVMALELSGEHEQRVKFLDTQATARSSTVNVTFMWSLSARRARVNSVQL
jgi:class 3 adenylate cyclase